MRIYLDGQTLVPADEKPEEVSDRQQLIDFADRDTQNNIFTPLIINDDLLADNALTFVSEPLRQAVQLNGNVTGEFVVTTDKRDVDITFALYEHMPDGRYFFLNRYLGRASHASDRSERKLLTPGERTVVPFNQTKLTSRQLSAGSRLLVVLSVNKHPFEQINYGTGQDVSDESIADADSPAEILFHSDSFIDIPLWRE
jgi:predicted acyl esterase